MPTSSRIRNGKESLEVSQIIEIGGAGVGGFTMSAALVGMGLELTVI